MDTHHVSIENLTPDPDNARLHPEANIQAIQDSLTQFGQVLPLVVTKKGVVIGGNGTLAAMKRLGWDCIEVVEFRGTKQQARALAVALNRTGELARWDTDKLGQSLIALQDQFTPDSLGFSLDSLEMLFPEPSTMEPTPPPPVEIKNPPLATEAAPLIQYALIFDDEGQQKRFFAFLQELKKSYPEGTPASRLDQHIGDQS